MKLLRLLALSAVTVALLAPCCAAAELSSKLPLPAGGKKKLLLFAKNPATWSIVNEGGSGNLVYREATGGFTLSASGLRPRSSYALIRYADAPPAAEVVARGMSDEHGRLRLNGDWRNWSKKFWVVSGEDVAGAVGHAGSLLAWRPERYLFEEKPLGAACACPEPEEP